MKQRILGIDTGTNSLGWAVVEKESDGKYSLIDKGSLIFQEGVKIEKGIESSRAAERTSHRALRKQYFRRRLRKIQILKVLVKYHLCPYLSDTDLNLWHTKKIYPKSDDFMLWQRTNDNENKNPYYYRHLCLTEELDLNHESNRFILGRALYHLAQRRGFLSNRLDASEDNDDNGAVKGGIKSLSEEMEAAHCEYLGEYFYMLYKEEGNKTRIRTRYTDREEHYKKEFFAICAKQHIHQELFVELEKALYFQRPLKSQRAGVGKCTFEPSKPRAAESHPFYEEFRMLSFLNNIKVKGPYDVELRQLNAEERNKALPMFYRKTKVNFDFEDIAKAIAGKNKYQNIKDDGDKPYKFNYRMTQDVKGCPTIAALIAIFGDNYKEAIAESYTLSVKKNGELKTPDEMLCDVWNVLYSFSSESKLEEFAQEKLQLNGEDAKKFSKIRLSKGFASISLKAISNILPFLHEGIIYSHAVSLAKIPSIVGKDVWESDTQTQNELKSFVANFNPKDRGLQGTLENCLKDILLERYQLKAGAVDALYHPSMIDVYQDARKNEKGIYQLGSPRTDAIRNPMAMRSLTQLRKVVNKLLQQGIIDHTTEVHIEYARELNDANQRQAIAAWNRDQQKKREEAKQAIMEYRHTTAEPSNDDIIKFLLWEEQKHICLYTGDQIGLEDFLGLNPLYDIEHTIPQSVGGDSSMMNLTLCQNKFNRDIKKAKIPTQLSNHEDILERISEWKETIEDLTKQIDRQRTNSSMPKATKDGRIQRRNRLKIDCDYWKGKYERFLMTEVPEGFALRQGSGNGLISKYAALYLKSLFHKEDDRNKGNIRTIKGLTTAEFRRMWGIQDEYEKKSRDNHIHHCIDAVVIACIGANEYNRMAQYYHQEEEFHRGNGEKPKFEKPWATFTEDLKRLEQELLVVHSTPDNMPKQTRRKSVKAPNGNYYPSKGDTARGALHRDSYYGAIERNGEIVFVKRKAITEFKSINELESIVDDAVKQRIIDAVSGKDFKKAIAEPIYMNKEKGIRINKVRYVEGTVKNPLKIRHHRDVSKKEYKQQFNVAVDTNYAMAIYEGYKNGKLKRSCQTVSMIKAAKQFNGHIESAYNLSDNGLAFKCLVAKGLQVVMLQSNDEEYHSLSQQELRNRLYYITKITSDGRITLRHNQEARQATELTARAGGYQEGDEFRPLIRVGLLDFNVLIEGVDFVIDVLGHITFLK